MPRVMLAILLAIALLAGCGEKTISADGAEETIVDFVSQETGFEPDDVECPDDELAEVGHTFECSFTGPDGAYTVDMEVTEVEGDDVTFKIDSHRSE